MPQASPRIWGMPLSSFEPAQDFAEPTSTAMSDRFAERSQNAMSDAVELAFYTILFLLIVLLWVYVPA